MVRLRFGSTKNVKLRHTHFHINDAGNSSSRKLRRDMYYTLYRVDPQKTHQKIDFCANTSKTRKLGGKSRSIPPHSPQKGPICPLDRDLCNQPLKSYPRTNLKQKIGPGRKQNIGPNITNIFKRFPNISSTSPNISHTF